MASANPTNKCLLDFECATNSEFRQNVWKIFQNSLKNGKFQMAPNEESDASKGGLLKKYCIFMPNTIFISWISCQNKRFDNFY